jgi:hypothetical protein
MKSAGLLEGNSKSERKQTVCAVLWGQTVGTVCCVVLCCVMLCCVVLCCVVLCCVVLCCVKTRMDSETLSTVTVCIPYMFPIVCEIHVLYVHTFYLRMITDREQYRLQSREDPPDDGDDDDDLY